MINFFLFFLLSSFHFQFLPIETFDTDDRKKVLTIEFHNDPPAIYAHMAIGYPMIQQRLHIDSGTDLTYVLQNPHSDYNPLASSSFRYRSCLGLRSASLTPGAMKGRCDFEKRFVDHSLVRGTLGTETLTFESWNRGISSLKDVVFGIGNMIRGQLAGTGTLGLAPGDLSITSSFNKTFSICLGNLNRFQRTNEFLALGDGAVLSGPTVALGNLLNVTMTSIAINEQNLGLDILLSMSLTIMDTGHSALSLVSNAYHAVIGNIKEKMVAYENAYTTDYNPLLCYNGKIPKNLGINLSLGIGNVTINFPKRKLFYQMRRDVYCLIVDESVNGRNYIGIMAFQDLNVGFDIPNQKLYIKSIDCNILFDDYKDELDHPNP